MSYTPPDQDLDAPLARLSEAITDVLKPMRERVDNPERWEAEHLVEIAGWIDRLQRLNLTVAKLRGGPC